MTREEIIALAAKVGAYRYRNRHLPDQPAHAFALEQLTHFVTEVENATLERAEKVCEVQTDALSCRDAIHALKEMK